MPKRLESHPNLKKHRELDIGTRTLKRVDDAVCFMIIKGGVEWCFSNAPPNMHVYPLFIKPEELRAFCKNHGLIVEEILGVRPDFSSKSFWKMVFTRKVEDDFRFVFTSSLKTGYSGYARKN